MHDIKEIRDNPEMFDSSLMRRGLEPQSKIILQLDKKRRQELQVSETSRMQQKKLSEGYIQAKKESNDKEMSRLQGEISCIKAKISKSEESLNLLDKKLKKALLELPNLPQEDCPNGLSEVDNIEVRSWGQKREFKFKPKEHFEIPGAIGLDFETSSKISGSRFVVLRGSMAKLNRAISQYMLDFHIEKNNLEEMWVPVLVNSDAMVGTGNLPKFADDSYQTNDGKWLIPTAEVSLTNTVAKTILSQSELPKRLVAQSQCFRSEAGSAGKDTKGMLRQHQFEKVEMVTICDQKDGESELLRMRECAEKILEELCLPYRTVVLCTGDMGFSSTKTYDIEVWLPGQNKYREISSISNCGSFQARRMSARYRETPESKPKFVTTLNGSGVAIGRCLIAILENYQEADGSIVIPEVLRRYINNFSKISKDGVLGK